ncbi:hypothetical protein GUJ93_ZPchr0003g18678 [Zizania palustris]|uniref:No apical meristem-associated C-terminal domain-containing protein n=1 Tax=Zizania palustris TaxID=103762 RepID=A0A8J5S6S6_ZIZPA|nr:hypothetical protein GUJ93_ZPchr0003g18678 [Zizania palustris]
MTMEKAHAWYKSESKDQPKWCAIIKKEEGKNKITKNSESGAYTSSSNQDSEESTLQERRPMVHKKSNERLHIKGIGIASSPLGNQPSHNLVLYNEVIKIRDEALLKSAEATTKSAEAKREQIRMEKL